MSVHTGDTGDPLRGDAEIVTGATDSPVLQSQASGQAPGQAQVGPTGESAPAEPAAPTAVPPLTAAPYVVQPPEVVGAQPMEVTQPPGAAWAPYAAQPPEATQPPGTGWTPYAAQPPGVVGAQPPQAVQPPQEAGVAGTAWAPYAAQPPETTQPPGTGWAPYAAPPQMPAGAFAQPQGPPGAAPPPANPWAQPPGTVPDQPRTSRWRRITVMTLLLVIGLGAVGAGGSLLYLEETRHATTAEANAAGQQELASLWQRMTIGQIFPKTASYVTGDQNHATATLIGIAPQSSCAAAADPAIAQALNRSGCVTMLRATYADQSGTALATVGIAVMKSSSAAQQALDTIQGQGAEQKTGILAVGFPGAAFPGSAREVFGSQAAGPYLFFYTAGYADGRSTSLELTNGEAVTLDLGSGVMDSLGASFAVPAKPCASKDISC